MAAAVADRLFSDLPEDVQINILSFLSPCEISSFASTSRRHSLLCSRDSLWISLLDRRWGRRTPVRRWASSSPSLSHLYRLLDRWDSLVGFWRRPAGAAPPIFFFEWGNSSLTCSCVSPDLSSSSGYSVARTPFLWLGISPLGDPACFRSDFDPDPDADRAGSDPECLVPVVVCFTGADHFVVEEIARRASLPESVDDEAAAEMRSGMMEGISPPQTDQLLSEIYQHFANRTSPGSGGDRASRRQRKRRDRRRMEPEHFVRIPGCHPTLSRPLQGLWKGICEDSRLEFFLVTYDNLGGVTCRRVGFTAEPFSGYSPIFWTSDTAMLQPPFPEEEQDIYDSREHLRPPLAGNIGGEKLVVSSILCINSNYDLVIRDLPGSSGDPRNFEGRIWIYQDGTFGFGFLRDTFIIDLKHISLDGKLLDPVQCPSLVNEVSSL